MWANGRGFVNMAPVVVRKSVDELKREKRALLRGVSMTGKELRRGAHRDELTGDQWYAFERLREINFLLANRTQHG